MASGYLTASDSPGIGDITSAIGVSVSGLFEEAFVEVDGLKCATHEC